MRGAAPRAGLYLHVPFCSAICPYCDFAVTTGLPERRVRFVAALEREIRDRTPAAFDGALFDTVYLGGGTPSILTPDDLARVAEALRSRYTIVPDARWSIEVNPEDVEPSRAQGWRDLGFGTVSLGVQSFDDAELRFLGRRHDRSRSEAAVEVCRSVGFDTVSIDLIFGLPTQTLDGWTANLQAAGRLQPDHVSCYQLTVHEGTPFARQRDRGRLVELPEVEQAELFLRTHDVLADHGIDAYEVSNFSRGSAHRSRHNQKYWSHVPYLGLGPSAHSFDGRRRWWNARGLADYESALADGRAPIEGSELLDDGDLALETVMLRLRTTDGLDLAAFRDRFGIDLWSENSRRWEAGVAAGTVVREGDRVRLTREGLAVADGIVASLSVGSSA